MPPAADMMPWRLHENAEAHLTILSRPPTMIRFLSRIFDRLRHLSLPYCYVRISDCPNRLAIISLNRRDFAA